MVTLWKPSKMRKFVNIVITVLLQLRCVAANRLLPFQVTDFVSPSQQMDFMLHDVAADHQQQITMQENSKSTFLMLILMSWVIGGEHL